MNDELTDREIAFIEAHATLVGLLGRSLYEALPEKQSRVAAMSLLKRRMLPFWNDFDDFQTYHLTQAVNALEILVVDGDSR